MQYRSIFADERQADAGDDPKPTPSSSPYSLSSSSASADGGLLYSWSAHRVDAYLRAVESTLPRVRKKAKLASALEHAKYTGASLARVGLDFRPLLEPAFADAARNIFERAMDDAVVDFGDAAEQHRWAAMRRPRRRIGVGVGGKARRSLERSLERSERAAVRSSRTRPRGGVCERRARGVQRVATLRVVGVGDGVRAPHAGRDRTRGERARAPRSTRGGGGG